MKTTLPTLVLKSTGILALAALAWGCDSDNTEVKTKPTPYQQVLEQRTVSAAENTQMISAAMDVFEVTSASLVAKGVADGRLSTFGSKTAVDNGCLPAILGDFKVEGANADIYSGTLILDYGTGNSCSDVTLLHRGRITDNFRLQLLNADGSDYVLTETVTFQHFELDSVQVDGEFVGTSTPGSTSVKISNAKLTYKDGSFATLNASLSSTLIAGAAGSKSVTGSLNGVSSDGIDFSAATSVAIIFDYGCSPDVPTTGVVDIAIGGDISRLDYGTGLCDKKYMITTNDSITVHEFQYAAF